jgi:hypothetical protein
MNLRLRRKIGHEFFLTPKAGSALRKTYAEKAREFRAPTWDSYFRNVQNFFATL